MSVTLRRRPLAVSPFDSIYDVQREVNHLFDSLARPADPSAVLPAEVLETDNEIRFMIEAPGMKPEDIELTVENNVLTICGEKRWEKEEGTSESDYHLRERRYGRFARAFALPRTVDPGSIAASYDQGVLTVVLPRSEDAKPRRIKIHTGNSPQQIESH